MGLGDMFADQRNLRNRPGNIQRSSADLFFEDLSDSDRVHAAGNQGQGQHQQADQQNHPGFEIGGKAIAEWNNESEAHSLPIGLNGIVRSVS